MGGNDQSTPESNKQQNNPVVAVQYNQDQQYFLLYDLKKMRVFKGKNDIQYYWIDPRIYNPNNQKYLGQMKKNSLNVETFSSIQSFKNQLSQLDSNIFIKVICAASLPDEDFKYLTRQRRIFELYLFCMNEQRANLLKQNFSQIKNVAFTCQQLIQQIKKSAQQSNYTYDLNNNILIMNEQDIAMMNKYRLNFHFLINQNLSNKSKSQFVALAKQIFPDQIKNIENFEKNYKIDLNKDERIKQTLQWAFKYSFFWESVEKLPKITSDPRKLGYLRHPVKDLFTSIFQGYKLIQKKPKKIFVVQSLSQQQRAKLQDNNGNYLIFTTFVKGYTSEQTAHQAYKKLGQRGFKFSIQFDRLKSDPALDFGFVINQCSGPNVIFNVYNVFQITEITSNLSQGSLKYGSLAKASFIRNQEDGRTLRNKLKDPELDLLRNYDYLNDLMKKIKNQGNILTLSGHLQDSIELYNKKLQQITRTNQPAALLDEYKIQKAEALMMNQQYQQAQKILLQVQTQKLKIVSMIKLLEIHFMSSKNQKIDALLQQIQSNIDNLKTWGYFDQYIRAKNFKGLQLLNKEKNREALKVFKQLIQQASDHYNYKFQGLPLMHQVYRNLALCETRAKNFSQAINLLNTSKGWQMSCQGRSSSLLITQRLIQSAHHLKGDKDKVEQIQQNIQKQIIDQSMIDINFVGLSRNILQSKNSVLQSLIAIDLSNGFNNNNRPNQIEQSAVNINLDVQPTQNNNNSNNSNPPRKLIDQSAVNISL